MTQVLTTSILGQHPSLFKVSVKDHLPPGFQLKPQEQPVTFEQLATFRGGIPADVPACSQSSFEDFINQVTPPGGMLPAQTTPSTSSIGFLGQVLMSADGFTTFGPASTVKWYRSRMFTALGMSHTTSPAQPDADHPLAAVYAWNPTINDYESIAYPPWCPWGTGDRMFSTAADLVRFIMANVGVGVIDGQIVPPLILGGMKEALTPRADMVNAGDDQAFAWTVFPADPANGSRVRGMAGGLDGVSAYIAVNPELAYGVVLLLNMQNVPAEQPALAIMNELMPTAASGLN